MSGIMVRSEVDEAWDYLVDNGLVSEEALQLVVAVNGYTMQTIDDVCYAVAGMDFEQLIEEEQDNG